MDRRSLFLGSLLVSVMPAAAWASPDTMAASGCRSSFGSTARVNYYDGELFNEGTTTAFVDCAPSVLPTVHGFQVHYVDNSAAGNLRCYAYLRTDTGVFSTSPSRFSCNTQGGCPSNSDPGFASNAPKRLDIPWDHWGNGVTCEVPPGVTIRFLWIAY